MAECPHYGRVTWFSGSGQHFRRFNQIRQPNGAGIGTRYGTAHKNTHQRVQSTVENGEVWPANAIDDFRICQTLLGGFGQLYCCSELLSFGQLVGEID